MAHIFLSQLKTVLNNCIDELEQIHFLFSRNPETDFTRKRKLTFKEYIQFMLLMQGKTVSNEILDFFSHFLSIAAADRRRPISIVRNSFLSF